MARESAGAIFVQVDGDYSPLIAKLAQAETLGRAQGQRIASGIGAGMQAGAPAIKQYYGLFDEGGRIIESTVPKAEAAAVSIRGIGQAARGAVPEIAAASGAIRVLEGNMPIRAVERFATSVLGLGPILQAAFPLVGAIALGEMVLHVAEKFTKVSEEDQKFRDGLKQTETEIRSIDQSIESLNERLQTLQFGEAAGKRVAVDIAKARRDDAAEALKSKQQDADFLKAQANVNAGMAAAASKVPGGLGSIAFKALSTVAPSVDPKTSGQAAQLAAVEAIKAQQSVVEADKRVQVAEAELEKQKTDDKKKAAQESARIAKEAASEAARIAKEQASEEKRALSESIRYELASRRIVAEEQKRANTEMSRDMIRGLEESSSELQRDAQEDLRVIQRTVAEKNRLDQEQIRAGGVRQGSTDEVSKLQIEQAYALQIVHTRAQELQYVKDIGAADAKSLADAKASLETQQNLAFIQGDAELARKLDLDINRAQAAIDKQRVESAIKIAEAARAASLAGQIQSAVGKGPATLLDARNLVVANGIGHAVDGIAGALGRAVQGGQRLGQIFSQLGRSILGEVVQGIAKIGLQMATTALLGKSLGSAIAVAEVTSAAAVGAANAAASTAAIPIIGPALAPGVAATMFAEIMAYSALASYDKGGYIGSDQIAQIHKGEWVLTADQVSGRSPLPDIPSAGAVMSGGANYGGNSTTSHSISIGALHVNGISSPEAFARALPRVLKSRAPNFSPATR